ncbi:hypothetical protein C8J56DRAFT_1060388 [Mycena floridula]|nr:hypothetical protein C8J56DRAFT_1060388 [Mycena floridula]
MSSSIPPSPLQSLIQTESGQANVLSGPGHDENNEPVEPVEPVEPIEPLEPCTHLNSPLNPFEMTTIATDIDDPRVVNERTLEQINSTMDVDDDLGFPMSPRTWKQVTAGDTSRSPSPSGDSSRSVSPPPVINPHRNVTHTVDNSDPETALNRESGSRQAAGLIRKNYSLGKLNHRQLNDSYNTAQPRLLKDITKLEIFLSLEEQRTSR